jgi:phosphoribosyl 1,2-cyclic phosphate phosphodiesterase
MRAQLLQAQCARLDAVLFTHDHADQAHGIDDLRAFSLRSQCKVPVYIDETTSGAITRRFDYCFDQQPGSWYPAVLERRELAPPGSCVSIDGPAGPIQAIPFVQRHGAVDSLGFRIGELAYSSDVVDFPEESWRVLDGAQIWIVDALQMHGHGSHAHLAKTLEWIDRLKPKLAVLTNLHISMDYETVKNITPQNVEVAYDGLELAFSA